MSSSIFYPSLRFITDITNDRYAVVTFSEDHQFTNGEIISLRVSKYYGMKEADNKAARVLAHDDTSVTLELDTTNFTPFVYPIAEDLQRKTQPPCAVPSSSGIIPKDDDSSIYDAQPFGTTLIDSFDNRPS